jgi:hypothetical protein
MTDEMTVPMAQSTPRERPAACSVYCTVGRATR